MKKTVVITGSSSGIGAATAIEFAKSGCNVVINYNNSKENALKVLEKVREFGCLSIAVQADVSKVREAEILISKCVEQFGGVDVLVNNAGISEFKLFTDMTEHDWDKMIKTNLSSAFYCSKFAVKEMLKKHSGKIVNISSMWGMTGASCEVHYSAAKAGMIGFTKALAKELGPSGINVNCIAPGVIDTEMNRNLSSEDMLALINDTPCGRIGTPEDIAKLILFLTSDESSFITGQVIGSNGGFLI
ncbi:MAG: elongation factor P 5-aminopentanone reductase [Acutalibacteraceae bacterium]